MSVSLQVPAEYPHHPQLGRPHQVLDRHPAQRNSHHERRTGKLYGLWEHAGWVGDGRYSRVVSFALLTQEPLVQISELPIIRLYMGPVLPPTKWWSLIEIFSVAKRTLVRKSWLKKYYGSCVVVVAQQKITRLLIKRMRFWIPQIAFLWSSEAWGKMPWMAENSWTEPHRFLSSLTSKT